MRLRKYRKHSSGKALVAVDGKRVYLPGLYSSPESESAYGAIIERMKDEQRREELAAINEARLSTYIRMYRPEALEAYSHTRKLHHVDDA